MNRYIIPLVIFLVVAIFLGWALFGRDILNPGQQVVKTPLVGKPVPQFTLQQLHDQQKTFSSADMLGKVWLVNVWASWCPSCIQEHPILTDMHRNKVHLYGLVYQDKPADAINWLRKNGDPYVNSFIDDNRTSLDFGVYGVPETFVVDKKGIIRHKFTGPISFDEYRTVLKPLLKELEG